MLRVITFLAGSALTVACQAQLPLSPRAQTAVADPRMVIDDRGAALEILPTVRAQSTAAEPGKATRMATLSAASKFSTTSRGVVFNHAMQAQGVLTGEIAFKMKGALQATPLEFPATEYPGLAKITNPNVFVVTPGTPTEYVAVYNRLKGRADVDWVEPIVDYSGGGTAPTGTQ